jgi:hypothetical protein
MAGANTGRSRGYAYAIGDATGLFYKLLGLWKNFSELDAEKLMASTALYDFPCIGNH